MNVSKVLQQIEWGLASVQQRRSADQQVLVGRLHSFPLTENNCKISRLGTILEKSRLEAKYHGLLPNQPNNMQMKPLCNKE